jgi:hypothetical protein
MWLLSNNRLLTRDNLAKRREVSDPTCLFCNERESISHLLFHCCVAQQVWAAFSVWLDRRLGDDFESIASLWIANKRYMICNIVQLLFYGFCGNCVICCVSRECCGVE